MDLISFIISMLKQYIARFSNIFSFIREAYFPFARDEADRSEISGFMFM